MSDVETLRVKLVGDVSDFSRTMDGARTKLSTFQNLLSGAAMGAGMAAFNGLASAASATVEYLGDAVGAASDLSETLSKTNVLFGEAADDIVAWSETAATTLGQSQQSALDAATTFATFGRAAGLAGDDLVQFSTGFTGLATDLASFNNTTPEQAINAIGAALRGESEPLRQYGVLLDDATLRAKAMELGIYEGSGALTQQQKVLAAQAAIYEQTSAAQGDFARTSDGLANQQRILDAQWANMQATIGQALLPVMTALVSNLNSLVQAVLPPLVAIIQSQITPAFQSLANLIGPTIQTVIGWFTRMAGAVQDLGGTVQAQTDGPLAYIARWWRENLPRMQAIAERVLGAITAFWNEFGDDITATVSVLLTWMARFWDNQLKTILDIVQVGLQLLSGDFEGAGVTLRGILDRWYVFFRDGITAIVTGIRDWFASVDWGAVGTAILQGIWNGLQGAWAFMSAWVGDRVGELKSAFQNTDWGAVGGGILDGIRGGMENVWAGFSTWVADRAGEIGNAFRNVDWGGIGRAIVDGILQGMITNWANLLEWLRQALEQIAGLLPHSEPRDPRSPLRGLPERGAAIIDLLRQGMEQAGPLVQPNSNTFAITVNVSAGGNDAAMMGYSTRDGVLSALRSAGFR